MNVGCCWRLAGLEMVDVLFSLLVMVRRCSSGWSLVARYWSWLGVRLETGCSGCSSLNISVILEAPMSLTFENSSSLSELPTTSSALVSMTVGWSRVRWLADSSSGIAVSLCEACAAASIEASGSSRSPSVYLGSSAAKLLLETRLSGSGNGAGAKVVPMEEARVVPKGGHAFACPVRKVAHFEWRPALTSWLTSASSILK